MQRILKYALWSLFAATLMCALAHTAEAQAKESKVIAAARQLDQEFVAGFNARDLAKVMSNYWNSPELLSVTDAGTTVKGWEANQKASQEFLGGARSIDLKTSDWSYWQVGDGVLANCAYELSVVMKDGSSFSSKGRYTSLRRKVAGKWPIVFDHVAVNPPAPPMPTDSLYKRLGGYDAIAAVSDDFLGRLAGDAQLGRFFQGVSKAHGQSIRQHVVDFLCAATGGPCVYVGRDMKSTHAGLGITGAHWDRMAGLLVQTFDKFKVPERERKEVLGALAGLKGEIVDKP